jgi:hypothetical protein
MTDPDAIAKRAYELFLARGSEPGHEMEDWLRAEAELNAKASDTEDEHQTRETGEELEPAGDRKGPRKRNNGSRRVARQPQTH